MVIKSKNTRFIIEDQQNDFIYKKSKSNLNISFNRISFIFLFFFYNYNNLLNTFFASWI